MSAGRTAPLSFAQRQLWFLDQLSPGTAHYNVTTAFRIRGRLDIPALRWAWSRVAARHETLRTTFPASLGKPVQHIWPDPANPFMVSDLMPPPRDRERTIRAVASREARRPFDLATGPLARAELVRLDQDQHLLVVTLHHIICDGLSLPILFDEMAVCYAAHRAGRPDPLPALPMQYADYARWQRRGLAETALVDGLAWWRERLVGAPALLDLPTDHARPAIATYRGDRQVVQLPANLWHRVMGTARSRRATPFIVLLAGYAALLARLGDSSDLIIGTPISGRSLPELEPLIGVFVNTLPLRIDLSGNPTFTDLLDHVRATALAAFEHQDVPFDRVVEELRQDRAMSHNPLVQTDFAVEHSPPAVSRILGADVERLDVAHGVVKFDLSVGVEPTSPEAAGEDGGHRLVVSYRTDLFRAATVRRIAGQYVRLLDAALGEPGRPVRRHSLLADGERAVLAGWHTGSERRGQRLVHELFQCQVQAAPLKVALTVRGHRLNYSQLNRRANQLAHLLLDRGAAPDAVIGVCMPRGSDLMVAILAVLKSGAAYLPLDPANPPARLAYLLRHAGTVLVLTTRDLVGLLRAETPVVTLDTASLADLPHVDPAPRADLDNLAYVIYTSGSTGRPKPVAVSHGALVNHALAIRDICRIEPADRVLQFHSIGFDAAAEELYPTWLAGGTVVVAPHTAPPYRQLEQLLAARKVTVANLPTSYWRQWTHDVVAGNRSLAGTLRLVVVGGERLDSASVVRWRRHIAVPILNTYGVTEATVTTTFHSADDVTSGDELSTAVPIGRPIAGAQVYVLDSHLQPVPAGVRGELYLGGAGLARGYLNRPDLTADRFVPHPFSDAPGARLYRTGDQVRWRPDGTLDYLARMDEQIKLRGYRIEPAEIETALRRHPLVRDAAVTVRGTAQADQALAAYVVLSKPERGLPDLTAHLARLLPTYMLPAVFVRMDELPKTASGKVDRSRLPVPAEPPGYAGRAYQPPRTDLEALLAHVWERALEVARVGVHDSFFEIGGNSLRLVVVRAEVAEALGRDLPMVAFYEHPTIAALARHLAAGDGGHADPSSTADGTGGLPDRRAGRDRLSRQRRLRSGGRGQP